MFNRRFLYAALTSALALLFYADALAQSEDRSKIIKEFTSLRKELNEKEKLFLSPFAEDQAAFAEFLKQPKTGLIRLFPSGLYRDRLTIKGGGASYSFVHSTYNHSQDIELQLTPTNEFLPPPIAEYNFHTGLGGADYGFIVTIGDVPLEKVTLEHDRVKFLTTYNPPLTLPEARTEQRRARDGVRRKGWYGYKQDAPVNVNYTYALRSIQFDRSDVLVAFRVVRKEIDGSVVILWKTLKQFSAPALVR